jgi:hypothetical protein
MAVVTLSMPDELLAKYKEFAPDNPNRAVVKQLDRFKEHDPVGRTLIVAPEDLKQLEGLRQLTLETSGQLVGWVRSLKSLKTEGVEVQLTEGQQHRANQMAKFFNQSYDVFVQDCVKRALQSMLGV